MSKSPLQEMVDAYEDPTTDSLNALENMSESDLRELKDIVSGLEENIDLVLGLRHE